MRKIALAAAMMLMLMACTTKAEYPAARVLGSEIRVNMSDIAELSPSFYSVVSDGRRYDFFVQKVKGGVESYIDACIKCSPKRLGFRVEGNILACNACGETYPLDALEGLGSCHPIALPGEVKGDEYVIALDHLIGKTRNPL